MNTTNQKQLQFSQQKASHVLFSKEDQIQKVLSMVQSDTQIDNTQIKQALLVLTTSIINLQQKYKSQKDTFPLLNLTQQKDSKIKQLIQQSENVQKLQQMSQQIKKQKIQSLVGIDKVELFCKSKLQDQFTLIKKQVKLELQVFSQKLQQKFKLLDDKIEEESYQTQKKLYQKWSYLFKQIEKDINVTKNQKQDTKQIKFLSQSNKDNSLEFNNLIQQQQQRSNDDDQEEKMYSHKGRMSLQFKQNQIKKKRRNYRYSSSDLASLSNHELGTKFKSKEETLKKNAQIVIQSQAQKRQLIIVSDNIKLQGFKKSCRIKIRKVKSWIAIGIIDYNMRFKPAKSIGERWVYYCNDGQIWSGKKSFFNQSSKFTVGQVVEISYDQISKVVEWRVKDKLKYSLKCMKLNYNQNWVPFIYFFSKGDEVLLLPPVQK